MKKASKKNGPKVSVVIPSYNHERYVQGAITSVLEQTLEDFELIVIDDGSTDNSVKVIQEIPDSRISLHTQLNQGTAKAINRGIGLARGKYISILNSDDLYHSDRLMKMSHFLDNNPDQMLAASLIQPIDASGEDVTGGPEYEEWLSWYDAALESREEDDTPYLSLLRANFVVSTSNMFLRSAVFDQEETFSPLLNYCHDYEMLLRISSKYPITMLEEKLLKYRLHEANTIKEHEFLRHLEVLYTLFTTSDWEQMLVKRSIGKRERSLLFKGLFGNPEMNFSTRLGKFREDFEALQKVVVEKDQDLAHADVLLRGYRFEIEEAEKAISNLQKHLQEYGESLKTLQLEITRRDSKLEWVDGYLKDLHSMLSEKDTRLAKADRQILDLNGVMSAREQEISIKEQELAQQQTLIENQNQELQRQQTHLRNQQTQLETKDLLLREIFASKGWLWLTRFRRIKQMLKRTRPLPPEGKDDRTDDQTYHVRTLYPVERNRPKIVHALANFMTGGSSRLVVDLIEHLGHKYEQEVITFFIPPRLAYAGLTVHDFSGLRKAEDFAAFFRKNGPDIVHVHYWGDVDAPWYKEVFSAAADYPCAVIENVNTPVEPFISDGVNRYVYVSNYAMHYTSPVAEKSRVIYPGSDFSLFTRNGSPIPDDAVGMVYRLEPDKLKEDSIQVLIDVVKKRPETRVYVIGGGSLLNAYKAQLAEQGVTDNFELPGFVPYKQLPDYYRKFSLFVAPVWKESFGQVSPFAMGMEIPVAGYNVGALSEMLNGEEFLGKDREDLSTIIIDLLNDREKRIRVGKENKDRALKLFSVQNMVEEYDRLYRELLHSRKA